MTNEPGEEALDGLKVDRQRNVYITAQTGIYRIRLNIPGIRPELQMTSR